MTFSATVSVGSSWKNWNTTPTVRPRQAASLFSLRSPNTVPPTSMRPDVARSMPATRFSNVDFPDPDRPTMATNSPGQALRSTPRSASNIAEPLR
jgi:hypothetical protein